MEYLYNPKTHTLHIKGFCHHTNGKCAGFVRFYQENQALSHDGGSARLCKLCQKERERRLNEKSFQPGTKGKKECI